MAYQILLVDDDASFREVLHLLFEEYEIVEAASGEDALRILSRPNEIDLVILDVKMPGMSGTDVLQKIKKLSPNLGIVIMTGYSSKDIAIKALKAHADDYLEKPVDAKKTLQVIADLLQKKSQAAVKGDVVSQVKAFLEKNYNRKVTLQDAARVVNKSPKYLSRLFRQKSRQGFNDFKQAVRMRRAKELLLESNLIIKEIADSLAYKNTGSFIKTFKKFIGLSPLKFRNSRRWKKHHKR